MTEAMPHDYPRIRRYRFRIYDLAMTAMTATARKIIGKQHPIYLILEAYALH